MAAQDEAEKLIYKLNRKIRKAIELYGLIEDGDKILIGLSGGKDSLALVELLGEKMKIFRPRFTLYAAHITMSNIPYRSDLDYLRQHAERFGITFIHRETAFDPTTTNANHHVSSVPGTGGKCYLTLLRKLDATK